MKNIVTLSLCLAVLLVAGAVCYYVAIALPRASAARLEFEKQKYAAEQVARETAEKKRKQADFQRQLDYQYCDDEAEKEYWEFIRLNGTPVSGQKDVWTTPAWVRKEGAAKKNGLRCWMSG